MGKVFETPVLLSACFCLPVDTSDRVTTLQYRVILRYAGWMMLIYKQSISSPRNAYNSVCLTDETNSIERGGTGSLATSILIFIFKKNIRPADENY